MHRASHPFRALRRCGQGPYVITVRTEGALYGERFELLACSPRTLRGHIQQGPDNAPATYGFTDVENSRCVAGAGEVVAVREASRAASESPRPAVRSGRTVGPSVAPAEPDVVALEALPISSEPLRCEHLRFGMYETSRRTIGRLTPGEPVRFRFWSDEPNDLEGVKFVIEHWVTEPGVTLRRWRAFLAQEDEYIRRGIAAGTTRIVHNPVPVASESELPPAPRREQRTPRPSAHAAWIDGYWRRSERGWGWVAGWWRVPRSDVSAGVTARAPAPPPPPRAEVRIARPSDSSESAWADGHWEWDGRAYVWIAGQWLLPPQAGMRWEPPRWQPSGGGALFLPGGWIVSVGVRP